MDKYEEIRVEPRNRDCVMKCNNVNKWTSMKRYTKSRGAAIVW